MILGNISNHSGNKIGIRIHLAVSRYMHSYTKDIFSKGFEPDDAFMDLMISLENLFGSSQKLVVKKMAVRAACLLETTAEGRRN